MTKQQRRELNATLRAVPRSTVPSSIEQARSEFAAFMGAFPIPSGIRRTATRPGGRPAVLVEAESGVRQRIVRPGSTTPAQMRP